MVMRKNRETQEFDKKELQEHLEGEGRKKKNQA